MKTTMMIGVLALAALAVPASADGNCNNYGVQVDTNIGKEDCSWEDNSKTYYQYCDQGTGAGAGAGAGGSGSNEAGASATAGARCNQGEPDSSGRPLLTAEWIERVPLENVEDEQAWV